MPSDFESILYAYEENEWIKIKVLNDHNLAVGLYRKKNAVKGQVHVSVYRFNTQEITEYEYLIGEHLIEILPGTKRSFKKREMKIARWYYTELCKLFKNGILVLNESRKHRKWD